MSEALADPATGAMKRAPLPGRRSHRTRKVHFALPGDPGDRKLYVVAGFIPLRAPEGSRVIEVFLRGAGPVGSELAGMLDKIAHMMSLLLQFGLTPSGLRHQLAGFRHSAYRPGSSEPTDIIGVICDQLVEMQSEIVTELEALHGSRE